MGTDFDSFDQSELGDFVQSELGDRNEPDRPAVAEYGVLYAGFSQGYVLGPFLDSILPVKTTTTYTPGWEAHQGNIELCFYDITQPRAIGDNSDAVTVANAAKAFLRTLPELRRVVIIQRGGQGLSTFFQTYFSTLTGMNAIATGQYPGASTPMRSHALTAGQSRYTLQLAIGSEMVISGGTSLCDYPSGFYAGQSLLAVKSGEFEMVANFNGFYPENTQLIKNLWNV